MVLLLLLLLLSFLLLPHCLDATFYDVFFCFAEQVHVVGECPTEYPLQKKRHTLEFLRGIAHLRPRTNTIAAVARVRSALAQVRKGRYDVALVSVERVSALVPSALNRCCCSRMKKR